MAIVSSTHSLGELQADGRVWVDEVHTDHLGKSYRFSYLVFPDLDFVVIRTNRAIQLWNDLVRYEIELALRTDETPTLHYATKNDFVPVYRDAYRESRKEECARLSTWLLNRMDEGWVTDNQVANAFNLTMGQWSTLKTKMQTLRSKWLDIQNSFGE